MHNHIKIKTGDITKEQVCAIVNAANSSLLGGGGVDGAIHRAGGRTIFEACKEIRATQYPDGLPTGKAVATTAGVMDASYVIHTVGPIFGSCGSECKTLLASCYSNSLKTALELGCKDIAFPAISTGIYGYPKEAAARIAYQSVKEFLDEGHDITVYFVFHNDLDKSIFEESIQGL
ncbi:O-acetyl-ADP-ribose deacetylase [Sulfurovum sp. zt1-1]|uniref:O-acetyl-ADP-ribose deacetylase n=1 Tax=Sulfurovum zhangzhouensis TaxID=3019067 RepID=A0ABT7QYH9_9BACT|nr:O-acetyl-ADP-ribose deacetylase [Sulfurovum zhangzhouensis]MDM5271569.1 O-acetyl-ADP-ribose deacetylase [Sulfurovum zhangzhouensis]